MLSFLLYNSLLCWSAENGTCVLIGLTTGPFHFFILFAVTMLFQMFQHNHMRCYIDLLVNAAGFGIDVYIFYLDLYIYIYTHICSFFPLVIRCLQ